MLTANLELATSSPSYFPKKYLVTVTYEGKTIRVGTASTLAGAHRLVDSHKAELRNHFSPITRPTILPSNYRIFKAQWTEVI